MGDKGEAVSEILKVETTIRVNRRGFRLRFWLQLQDSVNGRGSRWRFLLQLWAESAGGGSTCILLAEVV